MHASTTRGIEGCAAKLSSMRYVLKSGVLTFVVGALTVGVKEGGCL